MYGGYDGTAVRVGRLAPQEIALLRGGPRAAVTVAVLALHLRGAVMPEGPGTMSARAPDAEAGETPLEIAVYGALHRPGTPRTLARHPEVRLAVARMRIPLAEAGLLRYPLLGPTRATRREIRALARRHPVPVTRRGLSDHARLLAVALHGETAWQVVAPRSALRAGPSIRPPVPQTFA
ncbi:TIGR04222 domain-containing membrane protein [Streptomyces sp. NPDC006997]|uniref:TIGR04222 domain-containing membrane protein n=1 Tax=Streptomyces sp. NPDC006997 TaxID=3155356 RepID=UPI0033E75977